MRVCCLGLRLYAPQYIERESERERCIPKTYTYASTHIYTHTVAPLCTLCMYVRVICVFAACSFSCVHTNVRCMCAFRTAYINLYLGFMFSSRGCVVVLLVVVVVGTDKNSSPQLMCFQRPHRVPFESFGERELSFT